MNLLKARTRTTITRTLMSKCVCLRGSCPKAKVRRTPLDNCARNLVARAVMFYVHPSGARGDVAMADELTPPGLLRRYPNTFYL